jgi:hypothetical protein
VNLARNPSCEGPLMFPSAITLLNCSQLGTTVVTPHTALAAALLFYIILRLVMALRTILEPVPVLPMAQRTSLIQDVVVFNSKRREELCATVFTFRKLIIPKAQ